jgi:hypothetical protein
VSKYTVYYGQAPGVKVTRSITTTRRRIPTEVDVNKWPGLPIVFMPSQGADDLREKWKWPELPIVFMIVRSYVQPGSC